MIDRLKFWQPQNLENSFSLPFVALFAALIIQAFNPIFIKLSENEISPNATIFDRFWMTLVVVGLWNGVRIARAKPSDSPTPTLSSDRSQTLWLLLGMGIMGGTSMVLWAWSLTQTSVANSAIAFSLTPLFTTVLEWLIWGRSFGLKFVIGMAIALLGTFTLGVQDISYNALYLQGDLIALLGAFLYAVYLLLAEQLRTDLTATTIFLWRYSISSICLLPLILLSGDRIFPDSLSGLFFLILLAATSIAQILIVYSLKQLPSSLVALILLLDPVFTAILAWIVFSERLGWLNWLAFAIILLGVYLAISSQSLDKNSAQSNNELEPELF